VLRRTWGVLLFPICFVVVFFMAGSVFAWGTALDQFKSQWYWPKKWWEV
jgi:hypothetical protein